MQNLENLEHSVRLQNIERLDIQNKSYDEVKIEMPIEKTIIYCDPPYQNTGEYQKKLDYGKFNDWIKNNPYKIYISEYKSEFYEVLNIAHRCTLSAGKNNETIEKLFCNRDEKGSRDLFGNLLLN